MTVDNQEPVYALMMERSHDVGKHRFLGLIAVMDAKFEVALAGILCAQRHRRHYHGKDIVAFACNFGCIYGHIVRQYGIGQVRQVQIVRGY